ncbi:UNVERIFIED_CONTAM: hypothetical protein Sradi_1532400 [Sesamum radiatum]|uniref:Uncharacterized protein n=1 Tax=Sesamum radiatum TaxID=300843 RepID=A0AAW2U8T0_SESRA
MSTIISSRRNIRPPVSGSEVAVAMVMCMFGWRSRPQSQGQIHGPCSCPQLQPATSAARSLLLMPSIRRGYGHHQPSTEANDPPSASGTSPAKE